MIGSFFEVVFTVVGTVIGWLFRPLIRVIRTALGLDRPMTAPAGINQRELPQVAKDGIPAALQADKDAKAALPPGWCGSYSAISSDSEKIGDLLAGTEIRLILEPDNPDREDAVRAEVDLPDRSTLRIGHLRQGHGLSKSIAYGRFRCWFASRRRTLRAAGWEAVLFIAVYDP